MKIADFGIASARLFADEQGVLKGKFGYMSPEQARGEKVDRRSDLYALGVILWEILTGRPLHGGLGGEALLDIVRSGIVEPPTTYARGRPAGARGDRAAGAGAGARATASPTGRELAAAIGAGHREAGRARRRVGARGGARAARRRGTRAAAAATRHRPEPAARRRAATRRARRPRCRWRAACPSARRRSPEQRAPRAARRLGRVVRCRSAPRRARRGRARCGTSRSSCSTCTASTSPDAAAPHARSAPRHARRPRLQARNARGCGRATTDARAIAGLTANPSRAAADAAQLALDVHETIARLQGRPAAPAVGASIGIVRGIATGTRDAQGHLVRYRAARSRDVPRRRARARRRRSGRTWVAGGVYRLVRRDFRWGDAPTLALDATPRARACRRSDAHLRARAQPLARGAPGRGAEHGASDLGRARRREGRPPRGVPRGGQRRRRRRRTARLPRASSARWASARPRSSRRSSRELPPQRAPRARRVLAGADGGAATRAVAELVRDAIGTTGEEPFDEVGDAHRPRRRRRAARARTRPSPMVARLAELATNRQIGERRRGRARAQEEHPRGRAQPARRHRARAAARLVRGPAVGRQGEPRRPRRDRRTGPIRCRSSSCSSRGRTIASCTSSRAWCASSFAGSRRTSRCGSSRRGSACATARARSAPTCCRASGATRSSCSR